MSTPDVPEPQTPVAPPAPGTVAEVLVGGSAASEGAARPDGPSVVGRLFATMKREPVLFVSTAYILISFLGLWSLYWFYRGLGLPILDYLQGSDLFIAGLRRPDYALTLAAALLVLWLSSLPMAWAERNPERAQTFRDQRWWGKLAFPEPRGFMGLWGVRVDTLLVVTFLVLSMYLLYVHSSALADSIVAGKHQDQQIQLTLAGDSAPLPERARLLGTTNAFIMVWWPQAGHVEALPIANISRIQSVAVTETGARPVQAEKAVMPVPVKGKSTEQGQ